MKKIPEILKKLIQEIQEEKKLNALRVVEFMQRKDIKENDIIDFVNFNHKTGESYGRNIIFDGGFFKLMLMSWRNNDFTAIHDHGETEWGAVRSFGNVTNTEFSFENDYLKFIKEETLKTGEVVPVTNDLIHQTGNKSGKNALTMHLYGSNIKDKDFMHGARIFNTIENRIYFTTGAAYLKLPSDIILKKNSLQNVDTATFTYDKLIRVTFNNQEILI